MNASRKLIWITGASSGIGRSLALEAARLGYTVAISARRIEMLQDVRQEALDKAYAGEIYPYPADVTDPQNLLDLAGSIEAEHGPITHAILNAGVYQPTRADPIDPNVYKTIFDVNMFGVVNCLAAITPGMFRRKSGCIYIVSSVAGYGGLPRAAAYGASKAALHNMIEGLWGDYKNAGVHLGVINPGFVRTPMTGINEFQMPFIMDANVFSGRVMADIPKQPYEIQYPRRLGWILKLVNLLPRSVYLKVIYAATGWKNEGWHEQRK